MAHMPWIVSRRLVLWGGSLACFGAGAAEAQTAQTRKFEAWVKFIRTTSDVAPMSKGTLLNFPTEHVTRKQVGVTRDGVQRLFAVVTPYQRDGIILAAGNPEAYTFSVHRTSMHLRRIASARNQGGTASRWRGREWRRRFPRAGGVLGGGADQLGPRPCARAALPDAKRLTILRFNQGQEIPGRFR